MALFSRRQAREEKAARVTSGESATLRSEFSERACTRFFWVVQNHIPDSIAQWSYEPANQIVWEAMWRVVVSDWGKTRLMKGVDAGTPHRDITQYILTASASGSEMVDIIEAWFGAMGELMLDSYYLGFTEVKESFTNSVNEVLDDDDIAYQLVDDKIVPRDSMVLHAKVVQPALSLLRENTTLAGVEKAFQNALSEMKPGGDPADAITDAATALQEMLQAAGATGNALGPLLMSARRKGLLGPHDSKLSEGVEKIGEWLSAERSIRGDAHRGASDADRADAWLAIHVAGALIARLEARLTGR